MPRDIVFSPIKRIFGSGYDLIHEINLFSLFFLLSENIISFSLIFHMGMFTKGSTNSIHRGTASPIHVVHISVLSLPLPSPTLNQTSCYQVVEEKKGLNTPERLTELKRGGVARSIPPGS